MLKTCQEINSGVKVHLKTDLAINILAISILINQLLPVTIGMDRLDWEFFTSC